MPRHVRHLALALLVAVATIASQAAVAGARPCAAAGPAATLCLLNGERTAHGLRPLRLDGRLTRAALGHSQDMVTRGYFAHVSPSGAGLVQRVADTGWLRGRPSWMLGETLAWGRGTLGTPAAIVAAWMRSPHHRRIVLRRGFRRVGIALASGTPFAAIDDGATFTADFGAGRRVLRRRDADAGDAAAARARRTTRTSSSGAG